MVKNNIEKRLLTNFSWCGEANGEQLPLVLRLLLQCEIRNFLKFFLANTVQTTKSFEIIMNSHYSSGHGP